jgi:hypothetical protein
MANPGQPTLYKREVCELAHDYCPLGVTQEPLAERAESHGARSARRIRQ